MEKKSKKSIHKIDKHSYTYSGENREYKINLNDTVSYYKASCNCETFLKYVMCPHMFAFCENYRTDLFSIRFLNDMNVYTDSNKHFVYRTKNKRRAEKARVRDN